MNPARLVELRRQRELMREHLAWLDREIAAAEAPTLAPGAPPHAGSDVVAVPPEDADALARQATESLRLAETFHPDPSRAARETRRGCFAVTALVLVVGSIVLAGIFFTVYRDRGLLRAQVEDQSPSPTGRPPSSQRP